MQMQPRTDLRAASPHSRPLLRTEGSLGAARPHQRWLWCGTLRTRGRRTQGHRYAHTSVPTTLVHACVWARDKRPHGTHPLQCRLSQTSTLSGPRDAVSRPRTYTSHVPSLAQRFCYKIKFSTGRRVAIRDVHLHGKNLQQDASPRRALASVKRSQSHQCNPRN